MFGRCLGPQWSLLGSVRHRAPSLQGRVLATVDSAMSQALRQGAPMLRHSQKPHRDLWSPVSAALFSSCVCSVPTLAKASQNNKLLMPPKIASVGTHYG